VVAESKKPFEPTEVQETSGLDRERLLEDARAFAGGKERGDDVEEASVESFPASDAPSFTSTRSVGVKKKSGSDKR
jgi:hypothetical protein